METTRIPHSRLASSPCQSDHSKDEFYIAPRQYVWVGVGMDGHHRLTSTPRDVIASVAASMSMRGKVSRGRACFDYLTEHLRGGAANLRNDYKVLRRKRAQFVLHDPCERVVVRMPGDLRSHGGGQPFPAGAPARSALLIAASTAWCPSRLTAISRVVVTP